MNGRMYVTLKLSSIKDARKTLLNTFCIYKTCVAHKMKQEKNMKCLHEYISG